MSVAQLGLKINLPKFEGPLALLLYLIKKEEMDIFDIEIHRITKQYFEFIKQMKELNLEVAGDFVAMAATLIHIKSQLLLPQYNEQGEIVETEDPRKELVQRLLEYQKFQEAARLLNERPWLGRNIWARGGKEKWEDLAEEIEIEENALFALISSYRKAYRRLQKRIHRVSAKTQSIAGRILEMKGLLAIGQKIGLYQFIDSVDNRSRQILMTFLSGLELAKMGFVRLFQADDFQEVYLEAVKEIDASSLSNVEEYESLSHKKAEDHLAPSQQLSLEPLVDLEAETSENLDSLESQASLNPALEIGSLDEKLDEKIENAASDEEILAAELEILNSENRGEPNVEI